MARSAVVLALLAIIGIGCGITLGKYFDSTLFLQAGSQLPPQAAQTIVDLQATLANVAEFVIPSVVGITTKYDVSVRGMGFWWEEPREGVGSGVIVSEDGYVLTNNHVVAGADRIHVMLHDRRTYEARIAGTDPQTDIAVIKIENPQDLKPALLGNADNVKVGDFVLAVGSPFGLHHTVTFGIISAKGRKAQLTKYEDFIQIDAPINPGNSGGALVNINGEVIGINTAIAVGRQPTTRGNVGVGFSIPINLAKWVMQKIIKEGKVTRGYIGVSILDINDELAARFAEQGIENVEQLIKELGLKDRNGVFVFKVEPKTPAAKAGLKNYDIILEYNDQKIRDSVDLFFKVAETKPGNKAKLKIVRAGKEKEIPVVVGERTLKDY